MKRISGQQTESMQRFNEQQGLERFTEHHGFRLFSAIFNPYFQPHIRSVYKPSFIRPALSAGGRVELS